MSAIEASAVSVKTMADNTLRLTVDIEPRFAKQAFALFGERGTPMALAALKAAQQEQKADKPKGGPLAKWAGQMCKNEEFCWWLKSRFPHIEATALESGAAKIIREVMGIESRAEIDEDPFLSATFDDLIREPWRQYKESQ